MKDIVDGDIRMLLGYTGAVVELAKWCRINNIRTPDSLDCIKVTASVLTPSARELVEQVFHCKVYNLYSSRETLSMGIECDSCNGVGMHIPTDLRHVEIVDDFGNPIHDERIGNVIVTVFTNRVMPFIRYKIGDRDGFIDQKCKCGLPFPMLAPVSGRECNYLYDIYGKRVIIPDEWFYDIPNSIRGYRFVVHGPGIVTIKVVPCFEYPHWKMEVDGVFSSLRKQFGDRVKFQMECVDVLPHNGGKLNAIEYEWSPIQNSSGVEYPSR